MDRYIRPEDKLLGLPERIKIYEEEVKFLEPAKLEFRVKIGNNVLRYEALFDKIDIINYREANYGDDKIMTKMFPEYIFKTGKMKVTVEK